MKTITFAEAKKLEKVCADYENSLATEPDFSFCEVFYENQDGSGKEELATEIRLRAIDFDGKHDFDWIHSMLHKAGISENAIYKTSKGDSLWVKDTRPVYSVTLKLHNPNMTPQLILQRENGTEEDGTRWQWVTTETEDGDDVNDLFKLNPGAESWCWIEGWNTMRTLYHIIGDEEQVDSLLFELWKKGKIEF